MPMLTWMPSVLRAAGLPVREVAGWRTRGHGAMGSVVGVLAHHTAGAAKGLFPSENVVVNGRPGLAGPLCNLGLDRAGTWIIVAAGQGYHAGTGSASFCPAGQGNSRLIGVEAESVGTRDDWTREQRESYPRGCAALLRHLGLPASRVIGHKEWAPGRKIDPAFWDMNSFRRDVAHWLANPQEDDMPTPADLWSFKIPDPFLPAGHPHRMKPAAEMVGWAATHAANAGRDAREAKDEVAELAEKVAAIRPGSPSGPAVLTDADLDRIAARVVDLLSKRTAA